MCNVYQLTTNLAMSATYIMLKIDHKLFLQGFLDHEKENNQEMDKKLKNAERMAAKNRLDYQAAETTRLQVRDELETLKYAVDRMAADLESTRGQNTQLGREIKDKRKK